MTKNEPGAEHHASGVAVSDANVAPAVDIAAAESQQPMSTGYIVWLMLASFGASMAMMVPLSYGIAVRITELAPGHEEFLGFITGIAQAVYLVISPLVGIWSDRTRSRFGRRSPFIYLGTAIGLAGLVVIGLAPSLLVVGAGWVLGMVGWRSAVGSSPLQDEWSEGDAYAFGRGALGYAVFNASDAELTADLETSLPAGSYCNAAAAGCDVVEVGADGGLTVAVPAWSAVAIHVDSRP